MPQNEPFPFDVEDWLQHPIQHLYRVTIIPNDAPSFDVAVDGQLDFTFDQDWTPFCQADVTIKTPATAAQRAALDGRLGTRVRIAAGYRYEGTEHLHTMMTLRLQREATPLPGGRTRLNAQGLEMALLDQAQTGESAPIVFEGQTFYNDPYPDRSGVVPFIRSWINRLYEPGPKPAIIVQSVPDGAWNSAYVSQYQHSSGSYWSAIEGVARAADIQVVDVGDEQWRIRPKPGLSFLLAAKLSTGKRGTITTADVSVDRGEWFNRVQVRWTWDEGQGRVAVARVASGPLRTTPLNTKTYTSERDGPVSPEYAQAYATNLLRRLAERGRYLELTAIAAYWLRPGMAVGVKLGRAGYERRMVSAVTFSPLTGSMAVRTIRTADYDVE